MKKITSYNEYSEIQKRVREQYENIVYNGVLLPGEVEELIVGDKLYYKNLENGLVIIREEEDFNKLYYFIDNESSSLEEVVCFDKPSIVEYVYVESRLDKNLLACEDICKKSNYRPYVTNLRRTIKLTDYNRLDADNGNYKFKLAQIEEIEDIQKLWIDNLDLYDSIVPKYSEIVSMIENEELFVLESKGVICAVTKFKRESKKTGSLWLVVVNPEYRGLGLAGTLLDGILDYAKKLSMKSCYIWTDKKNNSMIRVLEKLGFVFDGLRSEEYILEG